MSGRHEHADEPAIDADDTLIDAPTQAISNRRRGATDRARRRGDRRGPPRGPSAALDTRPDERELLDLCRLLDGQASQRITDECLEVFGIYGSTTEPVLQCSHARRPLLGSGTTVPA